jgi:MYXO-CTERM domain-containing protein
VAVGNRSQGFYANHHPGRINFTNNTAYNNPANFNMLADDGYPSSHVIRNNVAFGTGGTISNLTGGTATFNSWDLSIKATTADFQGVDLAEALVPRQADGSLPALKFMHLVAGSALIDVGTDVGLPFVGKAPDLGAFEYGAASPGTGGAAGTGGATGHDGGVGGSGGTKASGGSTGTSTAGTTTTGGATGGLTSSVSSGGRSSPPPPGGAGNSAGTGGTLSGGAGVAAGGNSSSGLPASSTVGTGGTPDAGASSSSVASTGGAVSPTTASGKSGCSCALGLPAGNPAAPLLAVLLFGLLLRRTRRR